MHKGRSLRLLWVIMEGKQVDFVNENALSGKKQRLHPGATF